MSYLIANYCELENQPVRRKMKRISLPKGGKQIGVNEFQAELAAAETVGQIVKALRKGSYGKFSDIHPDTWAKLEKAQKCKEPL